MEGGLVKNALLVGRQRDLADISAWVEAVGRGPGHVMLIAGEAGIGKSRLMREAVASAESRDWLVLSGQASYIDGAPPYFAFIEALRPFVKDRASGELSELLGRHGGELARLLPELRERLHDVVDGPRVTPMSERFRFFESVTAFLIEAAQMQAKGLLLSLDDLHAADEASLLLLEHLARRMAGHRMAVLAAYRPSEVDTAHPLARTLETLARHSQAIKIDLKPFDLDDTRQLLASLAGSSSAPMPLTREFQHETDGNPFYIEELFAALRSEGRLFDASGRWNGDVHLREAEVPRGLRLIMGRHVRRVSPESRQLLANAAILGRRFDYAILRQLCDLTEDVLLAALDEATGQHLIEEDDRGLRFHHELIRQTLLSDLSLPRRQRLHLRAAEAIERAAVGRDRQVSELARHYDLAGHLADDRTVVRYAIQAGEVAAGAFAFEEALRLYGVALARLGPDDSADGATRAELHIKRAEALFSLGRWPDARPDLEAALRRVPPAHRAEVLINLALACTWQPDMPYAKRYAVEAALLVEELGLSQLEAAVEAVLGYCDTDNADLLAATTRFRKAAFLASENQPGPYRRALWIFPLILHQLGDDGEAIEQAQRAIEIARRAGDVAELANLLPTLGLALSGAGRYREAHGILAEGRKVAADYQGPVLAAISKSAGLHIDTFDLAGAKAFAEEAHDPASAVAHWPFPTVSSGIDLVLIAARSGEAGAGEIRLKEVAQQVEGAMGRHGWLWRMRLGQAKAEVALVKGEWRQADEFATDALRQSSAILRPKYQALALETRGKALIGLGRKRDGLADLRRAVEVARPVNDPAMFLRAAADLLAFDGDDALVAEAYEAAERIAANLPEEMLPGFLNAEPVRFVHRLKATPFRRPRLPAGLSPRELEVLRLIASGRSNQQIAETLVLSVRTVERHINHIYAKAGVASRTQAMAFAMKEGIGSEAFVP